MHLALTITIVLFTHYSFALFTHPIVRHWFILSLLTHMSISETTSLSTAGVSPDLFQESASEDSADALVKSCPDPCTCTPSLPPPILPGLWDLPPRQATPSITVGPVPLAVNCKNLGLRRPPTLPVNVGRYSTARTHKLVEM